MNPISVKFKVVGSDVVEFKNYIGGAPFRLKRSMIEGALSDCHGRTTALHRQWAEIYEAALRALDERRDK